jgi:hypothetical protein
VNLDGAGALLARREEMVAPLPLPLVFSGFAAVSAVSATLSPFLLKSGVNIFVVFYG